MDKAFAPNCDVSATSDPSFCVKCSAGYYNHQGNCVSACPAGTFQNDANTSASNQTWEAYDSCIPCLDGCTTCADAMSCNHCNEPLLLRRLYSSGVPVTVNGRTHECADSCDVGDGELAYDADDDTVDDACLRCDTIDAQCVACSPSSASSNEATCDQCSPGTYRASTNGIPGVYDACVNCTDICLNTKGDFFYFDGSECASGLDTSPPTCSNCSDVHEHCIACDKSGSNCTRCHEGFYLRESP